MSKIKNIALANLNEEQEAAGLTRLYNALQKMERRQLKNKLKKIERNMTLYRVPKGDHPQEAYVHLPEFAFEVDENLFFCDKATALQFGSDVVEINPTHQ